MQKSTRKLWKEIEEISHPVFIDSEPEDQYDIRIGEAEIHMQPSIKQKFVLLRAGYSSQSINIMSRKEASEIIGHILRR